MNAFNLQQAENTACRDWVLNPRPSRSEPSRGRQYFLPVADWTHSPESTLSVSYYRVNNITTLFIQIYKYIYLNNNRLYVLYLFKQRPRDVIFVLFATLFSSRWGFCLIHSSFVLSFKLPYERVQQ